MSEPFIGQITMFAGNFAPRGWSFCQGQILSIAQNTALFSLLGTTYGGNGQSTFGLPDFRGRYPMQQGQGPGLSPYTLGEQGGQENVTLISTQMPVHTHAIMTNSGAPNDTIAGNTAYLASPAGAIYTTNTPDSTLAPGALQPQGGSQPHNNMSPYLAINFIIALEGIYPSRN